MAFKSKFNPFTGKPDYYLDPTEAIAHADLSDMPDVGGINTDHDTRYFRLGTIANTVVASDYLDQAVKVASTPTFATVKVGSATGASITAVNGLLTLTGLKSGGNHNVLTFDLDTDAYKVTISSPNQFDWIAIKDGTRMAFSGSGGITVSNTTGSNLGLISVSTMGYDASKDAYVLASGASASYMHYVCMSGRIRWNAYAYDTGAGASVYKDATLELVPVSGNGVTSAYMPLSFRDSWGGGYVERFRFSSVGGFTSTSLIIGADTLTSLTNLVSLSGLNYASASFVKMTGANTFTLDTATYLSALTGDVTTVASAASLIKWGGGNVTYVPLTGSIATYITNATAGDTLILAAGTYTITADITILSKNITIRGQGIGKTTISCSTASVNAFAITGCTANISDLSVVMTGTQDRIATCVGVAGYLYLTRVSGKVTDSTKTSYAGRMGLWIGASSSGGATIRDCDISYIMPSGDDADAYALYINGSSQTVNCWNSTFTITISGVSAASVYGVFAFYGAGAPANFLNMYNCVVTATNAGAGTAQAVGVNSANTSVKCYGCILSGDDADVQQASSGTITLYNTVLMNNTTSGTIGYGGTVVTDKVYAATSILTATMNYTTVLKCRNTTAAGRATLLANASSIAVAFDVAQADTNYSISVCPPYQTSFWITSKAVGGFTINVGTTNGYNQVIDWMIMA